MHTAFFYSQNRNDNYFVDARIGLICYDRNEEALNLFSQMRRDGIQPNKIIYLLAVRACSQIAMIDYCECIVDEIPADVLENLMIENSLIDMWVS